jgi:hypothetical protein
LADAAAVAVDEKEGLARAIDLIVEADTIVHEGVTGGGVGSVVHALGECGWLPWRSRLGLGRDDGRDGEQCKKQSLGEHGCSEDGP